MPEASQKGYWIGFDLGGTKMLATVFDTSFKPLGKKRRKTRGHEGERAVVGRIAETIREAMAECQADPAQILGIGVGFPGPVDLEKGIILEAANLGWKKVKLADAVEKMFNCPVVILNDVDAGVYAENRFGAAKKARCVLGVFPGTGIGGGLVYDGKIVRGRTSSCMEIGHIQVDPNGARCGCGLIGCLETVASRLAISAEVALAAFRGQAPYVFKEAGTDVSKIRSSVLAKAVEAGDTAVERILQRAATHIGYAVATVVNLLLPDVVVLGGGMVEAMPKLFAVSVAESARSHVLPAYALQFEVKTAELGDNASVMGAAAWVQQYVETGKKP